MAREIKAILYNGIHTKISCDLLNQVIATNPDLTRVISITTDPAAVNTIQFGKVSHSEVNFYEAMEGRYPAQGRVALDQKILDQLNPYWFTAMKMMDRHAPDTIYSYESRMERLFAHVSYWEGVLTQNKVDCFVAINYPHEVYDYIIYALCKSKGIKVLFFYHTQIEGHVHLLNSIEVNDLKFPISSEPKELSPMFAYHWKRTTESIPPFWMGLNQGIINQQNTLAFKLAKTFNTIKTRFLRFIQKRPPGFRTLVKILYYKELFGPIAEKKLRAEYNRLSVPANMKDSFIYVPLHFQPECTTCPQGGYFVFQELMIELLQKTLPDHFKIYVKEHPFQKAHGRSENFYHRLVAMDKVRLVERTTNSLELIKNAAGVATVTGTAGWEALFFNKRVLMFGVAFYQHAPGVYVVNTREECAAALQDIIAKKEVPFQNEFKNYLWQLEKKLIHAWIDPPHETSTQIDYQLNLKRLVTALNSQMRE